MSWLTKRNVEQGTEQWQSLYDCFHKFAKDFQGYLALIDGDKWDIPKVQNQIDAVDSNLRQAEKIWPEGKRILKKIREYFSETVLFRNEEHRLCDPQLYPFNLDIQQNAVWMQEMRKIGERLEWAGNGMFASFNEVKNKTSIDVNLWLKDKNFKILDF